MGTPYTNVYGSNIQSIMEHHEWIRKNTCANGDNRVASGPIELVHMFEF